LKSLQATGEQLAQVDRVAPQVEIGIDPPAMRARNSGSSIRRAIAAASAQASDGATSSPSSSLRISSGMPVMRVVTQGTPLAIASISTTGMPSAKLGRTKASASP
jgi:uncharacterized iron-regulated membrane protein